MQHKGARSLSTMINLATLQLLIILDVAMVCAQLNVLSYPGHSSLSLGLSPISCAQAVRWARTFLSVHGRMNHFVPIDCFDMRSNGMQ